MEGWDRCLLAVMTTPPCADPSNHEDLPMFGRLMECVRAIALPCLMVLALVTMTTLSFGATFRFDPISVTNPPTPPETLQPYEDYRFGRPVYNNPLYTDTLSTIRPVRFQVSRILSTVTKVTLRIYLQHEHLNDLTMSLTSPDGITVRMFSRMGLVSDPGVIMNAGGLAQYVEFTSDETPTPPLITDRTSLTNNGSLVVAGRYRPEESLAKFNGMTTNANGVWRLAIDDSVSNGFTGLFFSARLYITQVGGDHVWTGAGGDTKWSTVANWEPLFGPPEADQINSLNFPFAASSFLPVNDFIFPRGTANQPIITIASANYPRLPFAVPDANSADQVVVSITAPETNNVQAAWVTLTTAARIGDSLVIANDATAEANGTFQITAVTNTITSHTVTIVRVGQTDTGTVLTSGGSVTPVVATITLTRSLNELDIAGVNFSGGGYTVTGGAVRVIDRTTFSNAVGTNVWAIATEIEEGELDLNLNSGTLRMTGVISGVGGITKAGAGFAELAANNTFTGANIIKSGVLDISNSGALGTGSNTVVSDGGTIRVAAGLTVNEVVTISGLGSPALLLPEMGALVFAGPGASTWSGAITLKASGKSSIGVLPGAAATISSIAATTLATYDMVIMNSGTLAINSPFPSITRLSVTGGTTTLGTLQPNIADVTLNGATLTPNLAMTVSGSISSVGSSAVSTLAGAGTLELAGTNHDINVGAGAAGTGGSANTTSSDLVLSLATTNGSFTKTGGGVLRISDATGVGATVNEGTLASVFPTSRIGSIAVNNGANLSPAGTWNVGSTVSMATGSALILPTGGVPDIVATGAVTLDAGGAIGGLSGAVLQPYSGQNSVIITAPSVSGIFNGMAEGAGITYVFTVSPTRVKLSASGGRSLSFSPTTAYTANEGAESIQVTVVWNGGVGVAPLLRSYGGGVKNNLDLQFIGLVGSLSGTILTYTLPIVDNKIQSGDLTTNLVIVPQDGSLVTNSATLTIIDNDHTDKKKCGFGTGLTVFFLFAFGLLFGLRLRRP
jgi:autotransporter-associated beta strand protein